MNKNQSDSVILDWGSDPGAAGGVGTVVTDAVLLTEYANFNRTARKIEFWGDPSNGNNAVHYVVHINEYSRRVQRNLESVDTVSYKLIEDGRPGIHVAASGNQPTVIRAEDWGGAITSIRVSEYFNGADECRMRLL